MFRLFKQVFIALLSSNGSLATRCIILNTESYFAKSTMVDLNYDDVSQGLHHYPFMTNESYDTIHDFIN